MKIFAIITPIYSYPTSVYTGIFELGINFFRSYNDEQVCGFSLNKEIKFFNNLDEAKEHIYSHLRIAQAFPIKAALREIEKAIIELEMHEEKIQQIKNIYKLQFSFNKHEWNKQKIKTTDFTLNAIEQLNSQYKNNQLNQDSPTVKNVGFNIT